MPPLSVMVKPASSLCNMRCRYCFYGDVADSRSVKSFGIMQAHTAENLVRKTLAFADGCSVAFAFQGGEPLLAGLDFFQNFVALVERYNTKNSPIFYGLQTNGTLLSDEWAQFFRTHRFLIGLSLDGDLQGNRFRLDADGSNAYRKIMDGAEILKKHGVDVNILTVLTGACADRIDEVYKALTAKGFKYLQFIPCLRPFGETADNEMTLTVRQYAKYLIHGFNAYVKDYVRGDYTSVRYFDNLVQLYLGNSPEQCGMCGHCMHQFVAEGNGNIYPCDFYCTDEWLLGNINDSDLNTLAHSQRATDFLKRSIQTQEKCKACRYYPLCRSGGCYRQQSDRDYCEAYKAFFSACLPLFRVFAAGEAHHCKR
ncbi:MAG: SPASM domain-containing protein [Oscillospiraceae bacterium]|nr:SPASM domain-containing protein [Oscillospiraceae bacterium]